MLYYSHCFILILKEIHIFPINSPGVLGMEALSFLLCSITQLVVVTSPRTTADFFLCVK